MTSCRSASAVATPASAKAEAIAAAAATREANRAEDAGSLIG
jgi:hypothetical protein